MSVVLTSGVGVALDAVLTTRELIRLLVSVCVSVVPTIVPDGCVPIVHHSIAVAPAFVRSSCNVVPTAVSPVPPAVIGTVSESVDPAAVTTIGADPSKFTPLIARGVVSVAADPVVFWFSVGKVHAERSPDATVPSAGVTSVGDVANTNAPVPVSSDITPANCAEVVAANWLRGLATSASPDPAPVFASVPAVKDNPVPIVTAVHVSAADK